MSATQPLTATATRLVAELCGEYPRVVDRSWFHGARKSAAFDRLIELGIIRAIPNRERPEPRTMYLSTAAWAGLGRPAALRTRFVDTVVGNNDVTWISENSE